MNALILRNPAQEIQTVGEFVLYENEVELFRCNTLERAWKNNERMVSCIPLGEYVMEWSHMNEKNVNHYEIKNVPGRDKIFIHGGNFYFDVHGCVILGSGYVDMNKDGILDIFSSRKNISTFEAIAKQQSIELKIQPSLKITGFLAPKHEIRLFLPYK